MKILFVYGNVYALGGIQTWLMRMVPRLAAAGHDVGLLTRPRGEAGDQTSAIVSRISRDATIHVAPGDWIDVRRSLGSLPLGAPDVIVPCNLEALLVASLVQQQVAPAARAAINVFSPREYCWHSPLLQRRWRQHVTRRLVRGLPVQNFVFAMSSMGRQTGACLGRDLSRAPVLPLPIDTDRLRPRANRSVDRHKIVSVARLAVPYTHHEQLIRLVGELRRDGQPFTYHVYGDGALRGQLEAQVRRAGVTDAVFFHGTVPYDRFPDAVGDAFAFIGQGTSLAEAAACGVPSLVWIDSHAAPDTYGFIHETAGDELGGHVAELPERPIREKLSWLASLSSSEYRAVEQATRARAEDFSISRLMPRFVDILRSTSAFPLATSSADLVLDRFDRVLAAALWKCGVPTAIGDRHLRQVAVDS